MKPKIIKLDPYPFDLLFFEGTKPKKLKKWLKKEFPETYKNGKNVLVFPWIGRTVMINHWPIILWTKGKIKDGYVGVLVNEIFHAVEFLYNVAWISYDVEKTSEVWAYMLQNIFDKIMAVAEK